MYGYTRFIVLIIHLLLFEYNKPVNILDGNLFFYKKKINELGAKNK